MEVRFFRKALSTTACLTNILTLFIMAIIQSFGMIKHGGGGGGVVYLN